MSIWAKVATAVRGGVNEAGEAIVDNQALRILDQEIRDADNGLSKSKDALASIIAKRKLADKKVESIKSSLSEYEGYVMQALEKEDEALATEIAEKIAGLETELLGEEGLAKSFADSETQLRRAVSQTESNLKRRAVDSLERLKTKQAERAARFEAASELAESSEEASLEKKLKDAGITGGGASGSDVLARMKAKRNG